MTWRRLGSWPFRRVALLAVGWIAAWLAGSVIWTTVTAATSVAGDTYVVVVHVHRWPALVFGPPALLVALWVWRRRRSRSAS